ncbi:Aste57867_8172 [Aphanomyces stellatus]|uniref:Hexose transporter 1 n=1 Tax=Aphanomyces stellatus TaxID=120398 RepID=A0A485KJP4_9STRA|nr:hypothetical protein As57867_008142 [Aphanomyces stellatus]VFT85060.1 Aste57867_8172 [Aphanomyces stellatus]
MTAPSPQHSPPSPVPDLAVEAIDTTLKPSLGQPIVLLTGSPIMRRSVIIALVGGLQFGWLMAELTYLNFNNVAFCRMTPIPANQCLLYPGHTNAEWTMAATAWSVGGALGALVSGVVADAYGRRRTLGHNGWLMVVGGLVQLVAPDITTFAIGRGLNGIASGVFVNTASNYLREVAPSHERVRYVVSVQVALSLGTLVVSSCMYWIPDAPTSDWTFRVSFGMPMLLGLATLALMRHMEESPVWLLLSGDVDGARTTFVKLYVPNTALDSYIDTTIASLGHQVDEIARSSNRLALATSSKYRTQLLLAIVLATMQQLCGFNALLVYGPAMFKALGLRELRLSNTLVNFGRFYDMGQMVHFGDRFSRRTLLLAGGTAMMVGALGFTLCQSYPNTTTHWLQLACTFVFMMGFCYSIGSLGWLMALELVPESLGATAGALATCGTWTAQFFIGVYFQQIASVGHWGTHAFGMFVVVLALFVAFVAWCVPDTRLKTTDQVTTLFVPTVCDKVGVDDDGVKDATRGDDNRYLMATP